MFDNAGNARDGTADVRNLNLIISLVKDNYIGIAMAAVIAAFLAWHLVKERHKRKRVKVVNKI